MFFYGTLRHVPLLEVVAGAPVEALDVSHAQLNDFVVNMVAGEAYPVIRAASGSVAPGILVRGLTPDQAARLDLYEGAFGYSLRDMQVDTQTGSVGARVYFPDTTGLLPGEVFDLDKWAQQYGRMAEIGAAEFLTAAQSLGVDKAVSLWSPIRTRAQSRARAEAAEPRPSPGGMTRDAVEIDRVESPYIGFYTMEEWRFRRKNFDGGWSGWMDHAVLVSTDCAIVLPYDPRRDQVLLIEQMRISLLARGDAYPWCLEPVAGRIDPGETPAEAGYREMQEEAGLSAERLIRVGGTYPTPGNCTEFFHCFVALTDLTGQGGQIGGLAQENEDIKRHVFDFDDALKMADDDQLAAGPLVLLLNWLARHREGLAAPA